MYLRFYILSILLCTTAFAASQTKKPEPFRPDTTISISENVKQVEAADTIKAFVIVEQMPMFPGGEAEMYKFIAQNLRVPTSYIEETGIQGRATVRFIVTKTGEIKNVKAIRGYSAMCDSLVSVIKRMPHWIPGKQNGETVNVYYTLPMNINLRR
ncbi:hypothetical protein M2451_002252 [Dysgonomonas sp. PFB1-18]|uniref:energy transducer TonB n=1 Tax=unclassified Dysgonomonas TaxID=2630389 RepID=UPI0024748E85|nr:MULTISPECIES: energy transducer TonB [unclassified Dysgonomonas]MDH6309881.1 hypothetical protein [Dysgonomonas sp. PF1-14]MDH6339425.1 hypothetical protein [Dysgonomonas sp. PF1-16]MDH6380924.1 hypothetical protein [Dysgonomonas sp. PFB1-18]MDH6397933.1 hypothetical protein [Dysgonomonas sp. PF1-23]